MIIKRPALVFLVMLVIVAATAISAPAQHAGFQIAIAPPVYYQPTVNPPLVVPWYLQPMTVPFSAAPAPMWFPPVQAPVFVAQPSFQQPFQQPFQPQFHQQFRQHNAFVPAQTVIIQTVPVVPQAYFGPPVTTGAPFGPQAYFGPPVTTGAPFGPQAYFGPPVTTGAPFGPIMPAGTPRTQVLAQLGQPTVTVITHTGETLYFNGGVTVIIQNGQVITGPR